MSNPPTASAIELLPVGLFGSVMGLTGLSVAWSLAARRFAWPSFFADALAVIAALAFLLLVGAYATKLVVAGERVRADFGHPVGASLFGTVFVSMLLLPIVIAPVLPRLALVVWTIGALGMAAFAWLIVDRWMGSRQQVAHVAPSWLVPVVGLLDIPLAMPVLGLGSIRPVMVFGLAVGLFFAVPLFTLVFARLIFEERMPDTLQASLMILLAPFAVGTSAYVATAGRVDLFAECLFGLTLFVLAVLAGRLRYLVRCCPFRVAWWAVSFPLAAVAVAAFRVAAADRNAFYDAAAIVLLAMATLVIGWLLARTILGIVRGELAHLVG